jgi:hypothetical protein
MGVNNMSHEIVKNISFNYKTKQVFITSCCNNIHLRTPKKWHCEGLSEVWKDKGLEYVEREILEHFYNGNFRGNSTHFAKIARLYNESEAYKKLKELQRDINKYVIKNPCKEYIKRTTSRRAFLTDNIFEARKYNALDAQIIAMRFSNGNLTLEVN